MEPYIYYEDAAAVIWHGDCRDVLRQFDANSVDLVLTDPPYGVSYRSNHRTVKFDHISGDGGDLAWMTEVWSECHRVQRQDRYCISFYGWPTADQFLQQWRAAGYRAVSHLVWIKNQMGLGHHTRPQHESGYLLVKGTPKRPEPAPADVFPWTREVDLLHPTQKPVDALTRPISLYSQLGGVVLDPFGGSGTTGAAAKLLGRRCILIEQDERYCEIAARRLSQEVLDLAI